MVSLALSWAVALSLTKVIEEAVLPEMAICIPNISAHPLQGQFPFIKKSLLIDCHVCRFSNYQPRT